LEIAGDFFSDAILFSLRGAVAAPHPRSSESRRYLKLIMLQRTIFLQSNWAGTI